jgi:tripartite-type tricarboxylate transporter receptor subunit TctC
MSLLLLLIIPKVALCNPLQNETITLIVPNAAGGLMARYARMIEPFLEKHLEVNNVQIRIMTGGGNIRGANHVWFAEPDGTTIGFTSIPTLVLAQFSNSPAVQFDISQFEYLGRASTEPRVLVVGANSGIESLEELLALNRPFIFPSQGTDEDFFTMIILADGLGIELKPIMGYNGNPDTAMAIIRGDGDGQITSWRASMGAIQNSDLLPLISMSNARIEGFNEVPSVLEITPSARIEPIRAIVDMLDTHRGFFAPPETSPEIVKYLRDKIFLALTDPELKQLANLSTLPLGPSHGDQEMGKIRQLISSEGLIMPILENTLNSLR